MNLGHWQFLTGFFQLRFAKLFITWFALVPIVISLLREIPDIIYINTTANQTLEFYTELPFSWIVLWIASLIFAFSGLLFLVFCPQFIKRHDTWNSYKEVGHSPRYVVWEIYHHLNAYGNLLDGFKSCRSLKHYSKSVELRNTLVSKKLATEATSVPKIMNLANDLPAYVVKSDTESTLYFKHTDDKVYKVSSKQSPAANDQTENDLFWELFGSFAKTYPFVRGIIKWLIFISLLMLFYTIAENILSAFHYIITNFSASTHVG